MAVKTPFAGGKGTALEGGFRAPAILSWPGKVPADVVGMEFSPAWTVPNLCSSCRKSKYCLQNC